MNLLFSYGTLQLERVQIETYGRILNGEKDELPGYRLEQLKIVDLDVLKKSDQEFHPIAVPTDNATDCVSGVVFEITDEELRETDAYEVADYVRVLETFKSGRKAWVYILRK